MTWTPREYFHLHGTLTERHVEELLDEIDAVPQVDDAVTYLEGARAFFPAEDFLDGVLAGLKSLQKTTRGDNRNEVMALIETVTALQQKTFSESEEGKDEIKKALDCLGA